MTITDTLTLVQTDTLTLTDTITLTQTDTLTLNDTIWLIDTLWLHDTVTVHDTIYITQEGIDDAEATTAKVYIAHGQIVIEGAAGFDVTLYDAVGRLLATRRDDFAALRFDAPSSGVYMVRIGNMPPRKVVVMR